MFSSPEFLLLYPKNEHVNKILFPFPFRNYNILSGPSTSEQKNVRMHLYEHLQSPGVTAFGANTVSLASSSGGRFVVGSGQEGQA